MTYVASARVLEDVGGTSFAGGSGKRTLMSQRRCMKGASKASPSTWSLERPLCLFSFSLAGIAVAVSNTKDDGRSSDIESVLSVGATVLRDK